MAHKKVSIENDVYFVEKKYGSLELVKNKRNAYFLYIECQNLFIRARSKLENFHFSNSNNGKLVIFGIGFRILRNEIVGKRLCFTVIKDSYQFSFFLNSSGKLLEEVHCSQFK